MNNFIKQAQEIKEELISWRRTIHNNPEVGAVLPETKAYVMNKLKEFGYLNSEGTMIEEYVVPGVDYVKDLIENLD